MSFFPLASFLAIFWVVVHLRSRHASKATAILPLTNVAKPKNILYAHERFTIERTSSFVVRLKTTFLLGKKLARVSRSSSVLEDRDRRRTVQVAKWQKILRFFYDIGSLVAVAGQFLALAFLVILVLQMAQRTLVNFGGAKVKGSLSKRSPEMENFNLQPQSESGLSLYPLIPGVTVPLSHTFPIVVALLVATTIHESGHGISGALDGIPLISWGYAMILALPAAFVELSSTGREHSNSSRIRVASAGSFHNFLTLLLLSLLSILRINTIFWQIFGYSNMESGVVVYHVDQDCPLREFLMPGSIITQLDDTRLISNSNHPVEKQWSSLLNTRAGSSVESLGWCVEKSWFDGLSTECCEHTAFPLLENSGFCFRRHPSDSKPGCLDPVPIFENVSVKRCISDESCNSNKDGKEYSCIRPDASSELLRLTLKSPLYDPEQIVIWKGPRTEILEQVTIGTYLPRLSFLPPALPYIAGIFFDYFKIVSLSVFSFNLLPVKVLDGGEVLFVCLCILFSRLFPHPAEYSTEIFDLERGGVANREPKEPLWQRRARDGQIIAERCTVFLGGLFILASILSVVF